jgi:ABC-type uncharacterized transport system substrate-binding protein
MIVLPGLLIDDQRQQVIAQAASNRLPAIYASRGIAAMGGLLHYSSDWVDLYRRAASYVDQILKGAKPGDLPVQQPTKFRLIINRKVANAIGITVPTSLLARADEILE